MKQFLRLKRLRKFSRGFIKSLTLHSKKYIFHLFPAHKKKNLGIAQDMNDKFTNKQKNSSYLSIMIVSVSRIV